LIYSYARELTIQLKLPCTNIWLTLLILARSCQILNKKA
jgi:hypothetical protein